ncbi:MAG: hypothetical protein C0443_10020 [Comamonadaceae bacterium]|nr:hypothetical protein [Comamonadaceae bacterium]
MNEPQPHMNAQAADPDDEISLLDLLLVVAENIRLLVLGPLVIALATLGLSFTLPSSYESEAWLRLKETTVPSFTSNDVLKPLLQQTPWITAQAGSPEQALSALRQSISVSFNKKSELVTLKVQAPSAAQAQQLNAALIEAFRQHSLPKGATLKNIQLEIPLVKASISELNATLERIANNLDKTSAGPESDNAVRAYTTLSQQRMGLEKTLLELNRQLDGFGVEAFEQHPSLPEHPIAPKKSLMAGLAGLASGFALLLFVFVRQALRNAAQDEASAQKLRRLRAAWARALGRRPRTT